MRSEERHYRPKSDFNFSSFANLSLFHPDNGMHPLEHAARKAERAAGRVKFIPKDELRKRRGALIGR